MHTTTLRQFRIPQILLLCASCLTTVPITVAQDRTELTYNFVHCHESKYATDDPRDTTSYKLHRYSNVFSYDMPITSSGRYAIDASWVFPDKAKKDLSVEGKCFLEQSIVQDKVKTKLEEMVESNRQRGGKQSPPDRIEYFEFKP